MKEAPLSQPQIVVQGVSMVTGEEHLREVMEGNSYADSVSGYLLPSMTSLMYSSPVIMVTL